MSTTLEMGGVSFISIKEAATLVSYSRDYVARLAREKKIVATQVSRQWYVDPVSLKSFAEASLLEQEVRKRQLSLHRRKEQAVKNEARSLRAGVSKRLSSRVSRARALASFVLFVGLSVGMFGYFEYGSVLGTTQNFLNELAVVSGGKEIVKADQLAVVDEEITKAVPQAEPVAVYSTVVDKPQYEDSSVVSKLKQDDLAGIFLMTDNGGTVEASSVAEIFSDDVEVRFTSPSGGVVVYESELGEVHEFTFVSVPRNQDSASSSAVF